MNILKAVLRHEVFPALGCTEPIAVAYAASHAGQALDGELTRLEITVDAGVYKNGFAVIVPNTGGRRGNLIAGVLGALLAAPERAMEILSDVPPPVLERAVQTIAGGQAQLQCDKTKTQLYVDVVAHARAHTARATIEGTHTNVTRLQRDGIDLQPPQRTVHTDDARGFKSVLKTMRIAELVAAAEQMDAEDHAYIMRGVAMNLRMAEAGRQLCKVGHYVAELVARGYRTDDLLASCEALTSAAADARMNGLNLPVMSSGGSGNQGIVAILVPYTVGTHYGVPEATIARSIAVSHLVNSYVKCYTGELSPLCGCAIAAGVGAAVAMVYQQAGPDMPKIALAINNLISDLGGMLCDGAKSGCALKVASSTTSSIRAAYMALNNHGITEEEGFVGATPEDTIRNLSVISTIGMAQTDDTMLGIMIEKAAPRATPSSSP